MTLRSINPFTEEINGEFDPLSFTQCEAAVDRARTSLLRWQARSPAQRADLLKKTISLLDARKPLYSQLITREMGKPVAQARAEIEKCIRLCHYYAEHSHRFLRDDTVVTEASRSYVTFAPLGIILGVMPWNYPFWQVLRFAVPTMMAGNACLLKHASNVPLAALELEKLLLDSGFPEHLFQSLLIDARTAGELIERDCVDGVSLTGSVAAGSQVGTLAGKRIKKLVLELGGSDPFIVLDDADVPRAADKAVQARTSNTGQSCLAAKRFIVMKGVAKEFQERFLEHLNGLKIGDPSREATDLGPLAKKELVEELSIQLADALDKGASVAYGPRPPAGKGFFFRPALLTGVSAEMRVLREEVFGPLAPVIVAHSEEEAIALANATDFGLGASLWSRSVDRAEALAQDIQAGFVAINNLVKSDPRLPFGGVKKSGVGREMAHYGLLEFVNIKTMLINGVDDQA